VTGHLLDGKRLGNGDPNTLNSNPSADIDQIPEVMIERVDVVTGGASATYGSDAMAGVVNFILRRNFHGVEVDAQYGFNQHCNHDTYMQQRGPASRISRGRPDHRRRRGRPMRRQGNRNAAQGRPPNVRSAQHVGVLSCLRYGASFAGTYCLKCTNIPM
jgi:outer membrane receptor protein involved in Fe transport